MGFSRQEYWSRLPFPSPGDLPDPGITPRSLALQEDWWGSRKEERPWRKVPVWSPNADSWGRWLVFWDVEFSQLFSCCHRRKAQIPSSVLNSVNELQRKKGELKGPLFYSVESKCLFSRFLSIMISLIRKPFWSKAKRKRKAERERMREGERHGTTVYRMADTS